MRKTIAALALLASSVASAQTLPQRGQSGYDTGSLVPCIGLDGSSTARCLMPGLILYDTTGVPLGTAANPLNVTGGGGSGGGSTPTGPAGSPNANVVTVQGITNGTPQNINSTDSRPPIPNLYIATASGTGYAAGDILDKIVVSQASSGAFVNSYWINRTQGTSIAAPTAGSFVAYFATAANQATQITAEQATQAQIGATTSPAAGTVNAQLAQILSRTSPRESFQLVAGNTPSASATAYGGDYILSQTCSAYGTLNLQVLGPDGSTYQTVLSKTASDTAGGTGLALGSYAVVRVTVTGTTACNALLARVPA